MEKTNTISIEPTLLPRIACDVAIPVISPVGRGPQGISDTIMVSEKDDGTYLQVVETDPLYGTISVKSETNVSVGEITCGTEYYATTPPTFSFRLTYRVGNEVKWTMQSPAIPYQGE